MKALLPPSVEDRVAKLRSDLDATLSAGRRPGTPERFREASADVDAVLARFPPIPDVWIGQDADPDGDDPEGPWTTSAIVVWLAGMVELRSDVRDLEELETLMTALSELR